MNLTESFKIIRKNDADKMADFFVKKGDVANLILQEMNCTETKESVAHMTGSIFDLVSLMQNIRTIESGTYIRMASKYIRTYGKYKFPALYNLGMILDNNLKIAYVNDNWDKVALKNPRAGAALERAYEELKRRAKDYSSRNLYCELQCDFVTSWTNGKPSYRHERICDFYFHKYDEERMLDSNPELIKWALLKLYEGYFVTFSLLAYNYMTKDSEVLTLGFRYGILYEMVNNFGGRAITCLLPDLGPNVQQIAGDRYLALCCPKEARKGTVKCMDAFHPVFEG
ncbi:MAG: hypothetical protein K6G87_08355 [Butyrivibrio sp.]|uniref:hypothetical protein n=1 Tax=Butyrivibrio sp. TaxID=28121 RepID=UPI0025D97F0A|nr:hypothetical protein [Butyrivibrio sp.]MCR5771225.1 hypothetical protein [Butyrivibrio sp.]